MKVAIFGGSFNPPTNGHEAIARACLEQSEIDELWLLPSGNRLDKDYSIEDYHRLKMLGLVARHLNDARVVVSRFELDLPRPTQTTNTLGALATAYPGIKPVFVFGADSYWNMPSWDNGDYLQKNLSMLIVPRAGFSLPTSSNVNVLDVHKQILTISSSEVRDKVLNGQPITPLVSQPVERYIKAEGLYEPPLTATRFVDA